MRGAFVVVGIVLLAMPQALAEPADLAGRFELPLEATGTYASSGPGTLLVQGDAGGLTLALDGASGAATRILHRSFGFVASSDPEAELLWGQRTERLPLDLRGAKLELLDRRDGFQLLAEGTPRLEPAAAPARIAIGALGEDLAIRETMQRPISVQLLDDREPFEALVGAGHYQERIGDGRATSAGDLRLFLSEATARLTDAAGHVTELPLHFRVETRPGAIYDPVRGEWFGLGTHDEYVQESLLVEGSGRLDVAFTDIVADVFSSERTLELDGTATLAGFVGTVAVAGDEPATHTLAGEALELSGRLTLRLASADAGTGRITGDGDVTMVRYGQVAATYPWTAVAAVGLGALVLAGLAWLGSHKLLVGSATGGLIAGYARVQGEEILQHPGRHEVYERIKATPGINVVQLAQQVPFGESTLTYHLRVLEKNGYVQSVRDGRYLRFFDRRSGQYAGARKHAVSALRNASTAAMARYLREHPGTPQRDLAAAFGVTASTITWHMDRLQAAGLVEKVRDGPLSRYYLAAGMANVPDDGQRPVAVVA